MTPDGMVRKKDDIFEDLGYFNCGHHFNFVFVQQHFSVQKKRCNDQIKYEDYRYSVIFFVKNCSPRLLEPWVVPNFKQKFLLAKKVGYFIVSVLSVLSHVACCFRYFGGDSTLLDFKIQFYKALNGRQKNFQKFLFNFLQLKSQQSGTMKKSYVRIMLRGCYVCLVLLLLENSVFGESKSSLRKEFILTKKL